MRTKIIALYAFSTLSIVACDSQEEAPKPVKQSKSLSELKQVEIEVSEEELAKARKNSGFKSSEDIAKENAAMFEKGAREYVKTRLGEYKELVAEIGADLQEFEKKAPKWTTAKDPVQAFEKFSKKYKPQAKELTAIYDQLTGKGAEGGTLQVELGAAFRSWEDLKNAIGPKTSEDPRFADMLSQIRKHLDAVSKTLEEIEADESLKADENHKPAKKKRRG